MVREPRQTPARAAQSLGGVLFLPICLGITFAALLGAWLLEEGRLALFLASMATTICGILMMYAVRKLTPGLFGPVFTAFGFTFQAAWLGLLALLGYPTIIPGLQVGFDVAFHPLSATLPLLLVPGGAVLAAIVLHWASRKASRHSIDWRSRDHGAYVLMGAAILVLYWPASLPYAGRIGYLIRVLASSFLFVPFAAGKYTIGRRFLSTIWWSSLAFNFAIGVLSGSRYPAFVAAALFVAGRLYGLRGAARRRLMIIVVAALPIMLAIAGVVGVIRTKIGRGGLDVISTERVNQMVDNSQRLLESDDSTDSGHSAFATDAMTRLVAWSNQAVTIMSPEWVPYRGLDSVWSEVEASMSIAAVSGKSRADIFREGLATAPARRYGFLITDANSVEFSLLADAWDRGGPWTVLAFTFIAILLLGLIEANLRRLAAMLPGAGLVLICVCLRNDGDFGGLPLLSVLRSTILQLAFVGLLAVIFELVRRNRHRVTYRPRPANATARMRAS